MSHNRFLHNLGRRNTAVTPAHFDDIAANTSNARRGSTLQGVCQRCKRFELDLTTASDSLSATDAELKASRQVISLLQRQLELFQVEKEGLEKLILSQSKDFDPLVMAAPGHPQQHKESSDQHPDQHRMNEVGEEIRHELQSFEGGSNSPDDIHKRLLKLINTQLYAKDEEIVKLRSSLKEARNEREQLQVQNHLLEDDLSKLKSENSLLRENLTLRDQTIISLSNEVFEQGGGCADAASHATTSNQRRQSSAETFINKTAHHFRQHHHHHQQQQQSNSSSSTSLQQIAKLSDTLEAYKKTNELLSQNVLNLTEKCAQIERREMDAKSQAQEMEARSCQIQSKLLSLLKEIEQSTTSKPSSTSAGSSQDNDAEETKQPSNEFIQSESVKLLIKRLLEDKSLDIPLSWKEGNKSARVKKPSVGEQMCDELGFYIVTGNDNTKQAGDSSSGHSSPVSPTSLRTRRNKTLRRGMSEAAASFPTQLELVGEVHEPPVKEPKGKHQSVDSLKNDELNWRLKWDEFIKDFDKMNLVKSNEFKQLLRSGVPQEYRCKIWKALVELKVGKERESCGPDYYQSLLEPKSGRSQGGQASTGPKQQINPSSKQIELDLLRTLPNNKYFETIDSPGTVRLRRVLIAFAAHEPKVGYCQGMNRLAAVALLVLPEEEAFWCLVSIVEKIMPLGYYNDLWLAQVDSNVVMDFVGALMPQLAEHFRRYEIELSLFAWFLTIFVDGTPPALFLRLWDCFLYEGDKVMFRVALALLKMHERELLDLNGSVSVNSFLRSSVNQPLEIDELFKVAFEDINPLPGRSLRTRRESHFQTMKANIKTYSSSQGPPRFNNESDSSKAKNINENNDLGESQDVVVESGSIISI